MLNVLICDDDTAFAENLRKQMTAVMAEKAEPAKVIMCRAAEEIGSETLLSVDLAFLDIDFAGKSYTGLDIARRLRALREDAVIIFITNYIEYAPEGYEIQAFRYLLKSELSAKLRPCIEQAFAAMRKRKSSTRIRCEGEPIEILLSDLLYIEAMGHSLIYHLPNKQLECYGKLSDAEKELSERGFLRIHKSYLVNMAHLRKLTYGEALLDSGESLPVGSRKYSECKKSYLLWKGM